MQLFRVEKPMETSLNLIDSDAELNAAEVAPGTLRVPRTSQRVLASERHIGPW